MNDVRFSLMSFLTTLLLLLGNYSSAQDLKGGEIAVSLQSGYSIQCSISLYVKTSIDQGHANVIFDFGDGAQAQLASIGQTNLANDTRLYIYTTSHTYTGPAMYNLTLLDSSRISGLANVANSTSETLLLSTQFSVNPFVGQNDTPVLNADQATFTFNGNAVLHNPIAIDPQGDSLAYSLVHPGTTNYTFPNASINQATGDFSMPVANQYGAYSVAIAIEEWRTINNTPVMISTVTRNMTVEVPLIISLSEFALENSLSVFPNPACNVVTFEMPGIRGRATIQVYNPLGQLIWSEETNVVRTIFDAKNTPAGVYSYKIITRETKLKSGMFVISKE